MYLINYILTGSSSFLGTIKDRNSHKLIVNLDVGMKKSGQCKSRKEGAWWHSKKKKEKRVKEGENY